jgi:hypothetical protein
MSLAVVFFYLGLGVSGALTQVQAKRRGSAFRAGRSPCLQRIGVRPCSSTAKAVDCLAAVKVAQVNGYLFFSGLAVGLLLNLRAWPLKEGLKRVVSTQA